MEYGLVLEGGGAKGSFQFGAYMALLEKEIPIGLVVGSSIGSLNGALIASGEVEKALKFWKTQEFELGPKLQETIDIYLEKAIPTPRQIRNALKVLGQLDIKPMEEMLHGHISEDKIRASNMDYGLMLYNAKKKRGEPYYVDEIEEGMLYKYILASCCYPCFSPVEINGEEYYDGGLGDNIPFSMVLEKGYTPLIIRTNPMTGEEDFPSDSLVIAPKREIGSTMIFEPEIGERNLTLGYREAIRMLNNYDGIEYYFQPISEREAFESLLDLCLNQENALKYIAYHEDGSNIRKIIEGIFPRLATELHLKENYNYKELYLGLLESRAKSLELPMDIVYSDVEMLNLLWNKNLELLELDEDKSEWLNRIEYILFTPRLVE